jgi:hypothetical protein
MVNKIRATLIVAVVMATNLGWAEEPLKMK